MLDCQLVLKTCFSNSELFEIAYQSFSVMNLRFVIFNISAARRATQIVYFLGEATTKTNVQVLQAFQLFRHLHKHPPAPFDIFRTLSYNFPPKYETPSQPRYPFLCFFWANLKIARIITSKIHIGLKQKKFTFVFLAKVKLSNLQQTPQYLLVPPHSLRKFNSIFPECCVARHAGRLFSGRSHRLSLMSFPGILMLLTVAQCHILSMKK